MHLHRTVIVFCIFITTLISCNGFRGEIMSVHSLQVDEEPKILLVGEVDETKEFGKVISLDDKNFFLVEGDVLKGVPSLSRIALIGKLSSKSIGRPVDFLDIDKGTKQVDYPYLQNTIVVTLPESFGLGIYVLKKHRLKNEADESKKIQLIPSGQEKGVGAKIDTDKKKMSGSKE